MQITSNPNNVVTRTLTIAAVGLVVTLLIGTAAADSPGLIGSWTLNNELTLEVQPEGKQTSRWGGNSSVRPTISVGGMPIPTGGSSQGQYSSAPTRDPKVLSCAELGIEHVGDDVHLTYVGVGSETLTPGNVQGTRTSFSQRKLTSRYETTTRKVSKTFELRKDGRLLVTVKLNPKQGATVVHKRVFDRSG
ncbi:MAG: hypothetical protein VB948_07640 [Pseudomonadales bacterium]|jgi:hypothetical protein